jgi:hypothetical protein
LSFQRCFNSDNRRGRIALDDTVRQRSFSAALRRRTLDMLIPTTARYLPRNPESNAVSRRIAALRAELSDLRSSFAERIERLEKEQGIHLRRVAEIQQALDELRRMLKRVSDRL